MFRQWSSMFKVCVLVGFCVLGSVVCIAEVPSGKLVFSEDFSKANPGDSVATIKGWEVISQNGASFTIENDHSVKITHSVWNGTSYSNDSMAYKLDKKVEKGSIELELKLVSPAASWSLQIYVGNQMCAFERNVWRFLLSGDGKWHEIEPLEFDKWHLIRIDFDTTADPPFIKFYADGKDIVQIPRENFTGMDTVTLGDYGACKDRIVNYVRNIKVYSEK